MNLADWKDVATIIGIIISVLTYLTNSYFQLRNKRIENIKRYIDAHDDMFKENDFIMCNIEKFEDNSYTRDETGKDMEKKLNRFLGKVENIACLTSSGAVPMSIQVYMFGWFAKKIQPHLKKERDNIFWELAIHYIDELKKAADDYSLQPNKRREKYLKKNTLTHSRYSLTR